MFRVQLSAPKEGADPVLIEGFMDFARKLSAPAIAIRYDGAADSYSLTVGVLPDPPKEG